jgi:hypothetical protein
MKKINYYISVFLLFAALVSAIGFISFDNNTAAANLPNIIKEKGIKNLSEMISERKQHGDIKQVSLFKSSALNTAKNIQGFVTKSDFLEIDKNALNSLNSSVSNDLILSIETSQNGVFVLELTKVSIFPENFMVKVIESGSTRYEHFDQPLTYRGIIKDKPNSFAAITISKNHVMGLISDERGDFNLGPKKDVSNKFTDEYLIYNDMDLVNHSKFKCELDNHMEMNDKLFEKGIKGRSQNNNFDNPRTTDPIRVYFVADFRTYQDNGSSTAQTTLFLTNVFNNVSTIYQNESIPTALSSNLTVYTTTDPYANLNDSYDILNLFGNNTRDNFNGDLAHLVSTGHNQQLGGIAWINILCQPYVYFPAPDDAHYGRFAFSNIENSFNPYPLYSWTVEVVTHEMGHNVASKHTQACVWPTNSGQIDSCYQSEGGCVSGTRPNNNGTIMSYCHLNGAINLANGFGPFPQDTIQLGYALAQCIDSALNSSEVPLSFSLLQNFPNPFNPSTNIRFALPEEGLVTLRIYDVTGREVSVLVNNVYYNAGVFSSSFDASAFGLASGVYFYRLDVNRDNRNIYSEIKKMVLVK